MSAATNTCLKQALDDSIKAAAEKAGAGQMSRNRKLSVADIIRLLIGAEGGSLDKIRRRSQSSRSLPDPINRHIFHPHCIF